MNLSKIKFVAATILLTLGMSAAPAAADVTWNFTAVNVGPGTEPNITGTITTPNPPFGNFVGDFNPPSFWPVTGQIVIAPGTLGGPGEVFGINDAEVPAIVIFHDGTTWLDLNFFLQGVSYQSFGIEPFTFLLNFEGPNGPGIWAIQSIELGDSDGDGVVDAEDACPGTVIPESVPTVSLGVNRFALTDANGVFDTTPPNGQGPTKSFTIEETAGCSCAQIIAELNLGNGHEKFGCSINAMEDWTALVGGI